VFRKTNKDASNGEHSMAFIATYTNSNATLKAQRYMIPQQADIEPHLDCYTHTNNWLNHLESLMGHPLHDGDFLFPAIASTGKLKIGEKISHTGFKTFMTEIIECSGVLKGRNGKFTTHCFRRGGAQYRFMWAKRKWSLKVIKWWGGWSSGERVSFKVLLRSPLSHLIV
jgi:hypothetical protein